MGLFSRAVKFVLNLRDHQHITMCLARGSASASSRSINPVIPSTWEFSGFSQNGEDGIIDFLRRHLLRPNNYFIEIGSSNGLDNNTAWLAFAQRYSGMMIEGDPRASSRGRQIIGDLCIGVDFVEMFVDETNAREIYERSVFKNPDIFSIDIDGNDYYVAKTLLDAGLRPKIIVVEYNSVFGPSLAVTVPYRRNFDFREAHSSQLYYGVSISGWRKFLAGLGYRFVTVDKNGVNGFFVAQEEFSDLIVDKIEGIEFAENFYQLKKFRKPASEQLNLIKDLPLVNL